MSTDKSHRVLCPSGRAKEGALLLGVRQADGKVAILPEALPISDQFLAHAKQVHEIPEQMFRFTHKCIEGGCKQWNGKGCSVADRAVDMMDSLSLAKNVDFPCSIRQDCRWFMQKGMDACRICPYIITEITEAEVDRYFTNMQVND